MALAESVEAWRLFSPVRRPIPFMISRLKVAARRSPEVKSTPTRSGFAVALVRPMEVS